MISHYTAIVFIVAFCMCIMIASTFDRKFMPSKERRRFALLFALLILVNIAEWRAATINGGDTEYILLHKISKFVEFMVAPIIPAVCVSVLGTKKIAKEFTVLIGINVLFQVISLFTGIIFSIDANNVYHRGDFYAVYAAVTVLGMIFLLIRGIQFCKQYQYQNIVFLSLIMLLAMLGMVSQMVYSYLRLDWVCASIAAIMFFMYYDQLVQQIDDLTTLLNRRSYEYHVSRLKKPADILFFDVDRFKNVNDTYGHSYGDECLLCLAVEIKRVFGKHGLCYRFGGDEFCVVMEHGAEDIQTLISTYLNAINTLRTQDSRIPYVSIGYTTYIPAQESFNDAIIRADAMMYKYKEIHHNQASVDTASN